MGPTTPAPGATIEAVNSASRLRSRWTGAGLVALSAAGFATLSVFGKIGLAGGMTLAGMLSLRFAGAALLLGLGLAAARRLPRGLTLRTAAGLLALGAFGYGVQSTLYFSGLQRIPASICALLLYVYPLFVALYDRLFNGRPLHRAALTALALALAGVVLTVRPTASGALDPLGLAFVVGSAAWYAGYIILSERVVQRLGAWTSTAGVSVGAALAFTAAGWITGTLDWSLSADQLRLLLGLVVVSTILPVATFLAGVARLGPTTASIVSTLEPVFTALLAAWVLRESLAPIQALGGLFVLAGAVWVQWKT
ncbi:MAG TPA: DMT family transporter [Anaerolineales bacterium]|nr:DMT family transporter [Anaerolineales bacterium]